MKNLQDIDKKANDQSCLDGLVLLQRYIEAYKARRTSWDAFEKLTGVTQEQYKQSKKSD